MLKTIRNLLSKFRAEGHEEIETPLGVTVTFTLQYDKLPVGTLQLTAGHWQFRYSREFREQKKIDPLVAFPDVNKVYESDVLWPFFMARIPGLSQPEIREKIREKGLDERSAVDLLRLFGETTISNPFVLRESAGTPVVNRVAVRA